MTNFTLIALHGNGGGAFRFARTAPYMPSNIQFVALTLPGFADQPADPKLTSLHAYAERLLELLTVYPHPKVLLGHGIGGAIALELVQFAPTSLDGVILHAPVGARLDQRRFPKLMQPLIVRKLGQWAFSAPLLRPLWRRLLFTADVPTDYLAQFFDEYRRCKVFAQMFDLITAEWFSTLQPIQIPAGLLWGAQERILNVEQLEDYKALLPQHIVKIVPDWDHFPMIEQPRLYAQVVSTLAGEVLQFKEVTKG